MDRRDLRGYGDAPPDVRWPNGAQLAVSLPEEIRPVVKSMGVDGPNQVTMTLLTGAVVRFGEPVDLRNKLVNVVVILRRQDINQIAGIDVSSGTPVVTSP